MRINEKLLIPFDKESGKMRDYIWMEESNYDMRKNIPFKAKLKVVGIEKGRSKCSYILEDIKSGDTYSFNYSAFMEVVQSFNVIGGVIDGVFSFRKRGANISCQAHIIK